MTDYTYPDKNDKLFLQFLHEKEAGHYWEESEIRILQMIKNHLKNFHPESNSRFLDAGCGTGRLIPEFASLFSEIVAVEPDSQRMESAMEYIHRSGFGHNTKFFNLSIEDFSKTGTKPYDFILSSHVIQHIHSNSVKPMLAILADMLKPNGYLAITTCHSTTGSCHFIKSYFEHGHTAKKEITENQFNNIVNNITYLPVQFFDPGFLIEFLVINELKLINFRIFHIEKPDRQKSGTNDPDLYFNATAKRQQKHGMDMLILVQKSQDKRK